MTGSVIDRSFGRSAFGMDPAGYLAARPNYPEWVFDALRDRCDLSPGTATFEVGPGPGTATRRLLGLGARPLVAIEPDPALAGFLRAENQDDVLDMQVAPFEEVALPTSSFDLGFCATAFHWLDEGAALAKVGRLLRPGGWWAMVWNVFGHDSQPSPFHDTTRELLDGPVSPAVGQGSSPFGLDVEARRDAMKRSGAFDVIEHEVRTWSLEMDTAEVVALYVTFSNVTARPDKEAVLAALERVARDDFGGRVIRNMTTSLYLARRGSPET